MGFISPAALSLILYSHGPAKLGVTNRGSYYIFIEMNSDTKHQMEIILSLLKEYEDQA